MSHTSRERKDLHLVSVSVSCQIFVKASDLCVTILIDMADDGAEVAAAVREADISLLRAHSVRRFPTTGVVHLLKGRKLWD